MSNNKVQIIIEAIQKNFDSLKGELKGVEGGFKDIQSEVGRSSESILNLKNAIVALATGAAVKSIIDTFVSYNKVLETSKLGISAILTSMAQITDEQGRVLQGSEKWQASQKLAVSAQKELLKIAMTTSATYTELVEVYQGILAPALSAKMTFKETLEITGLLTNAVKAIGLPVNQIKQEARDLIQGGIQPASSSLAIALGVSDSMVKKWREMGTVADELKKRLTGFVYASNEFSNTWEGAWSNFKDFAQRALGEGLKPVFDKLKKEIIEISNSFVNITKDSSGQVLDIQIKPEVKEKIEAVGRAVLKIIDYAKDLLGFMLKWGDEIIFATVVAGISKITTAIITAGIEAKALWTTMRSIGVIGALGSKGGLIGLGVGIAAAGGWYAYDAAKEGKSAQKEFESIASRLSSLPKGLDVNTYQEMRKRLPGLTEAQMGRAIESGAARTEVDSYHPLLGTQYKIVVDKDAIAKQEKEFAASQGSTTDNLGVSTPKAPKTEEEKKAAQKAAIAIENEKLAAKIAGIKMSAEQDKEAWAEEKKNLELNYKEGLIDWSSYQDQLREIDQGRAGDALANLEQQKAAETDAHNKRLTNLKIEAVTETDKSNLSLNLSKENREYTEKIGKLDIEISKTKGEHIVAEINNRITLADMATKTATAEKEGELKVQETKLNGLKALLPLMEAERDLSPIEAKKKEVEIEYALIDLKQKEVEIKSAKNPAEEAKKQADLNKLQEDFNNLKAKEPLIIAEATRQTLAKNIAEQQGALQEQLALAHLYADRGNEKQLQIELIDLEIKKIGINKTLSEEQKTASIERLNAQRQEIADMQTYTGAVKQGLKDVLREYGDTYDKIRRVITDTFSAAQRSFSDVFYDGFKGQLKGIGDYWGSFWDSMYRIFADTLAKMILSSETKEIVLKFGASWTAKALDILGEIYKWYGGGGGGTASGGGGEVTPSAPADVGYWAYGGKIPGFAFGGDSPANDTVPAMLSPGEYVVRRSIVNAIAGQGRGGDSILAHINQEEAALLKALGGSGTRNPKTGLPEFFGFSDFVNTFFNPASSPLLSNPGGVEGWINAFADPTGVVQGGTRGIGSAFPALAPGARIFAPIIGGIIGGPGGAAAGSRIGADWTAGATGQPVDDRSAFINAGITAIGTWIAQGGLSDAFGGTASGAGGMEGYPSSPDPASPYYNPAIDPNSPYYDPGSVSTPTISSAGPGTISWIRYLNAALAAFRSLVSSGGAYNVFLDSIEDNGLYGSLKKLFADIAPKEYTLPIMGLARAHNGYKFDYDLGLGSDEYPFIGQTGERMLSRGGNDVFEKLLARIGQEMNPGAIASQKDTGVNSLYVTIITPDGKILKQETLSELKTRSRRGEVVIDARGVGSR